MESTRVWSVVVVAILVSVSLDLRAETVCETVCMEKHDAEMEICGRKHKVCMKSCPSSGLRSFCVSGCTKSQKSCSKKAFQAEKACIDECVSKTGV